MSSKFGSMDISVVIDGFGGRYRIDTINDNRMKGLETIIRRGVRLGT